MGKEIRCKRCITYQYYKKQNYIYGLQKCDDLIPSRRSDLSSRHCKRKYRIMLCKKVRDYRCWKRYRKSQYKVV